MLAEIEINPQILQKNLQKQHKILCWILAGCRFRCAWVNRCDIVLLFQSKKLFASVKTLFYVIVLFSTFFKNLCLVFFDIQQKHILLLNWIHAWLWRPWLCKWTIRKEESPDEYRIEKKRRRAAKSRRKLLFFTHLFSG